MFLNSIHKFLQMYMIALSRLPMGQRAKQMPRAAVDFYKQICGGFYLSEEQIYIQVNHYARYAKSAIA